MSIKELKLENAQLKAKLLGFINALECEQPDKLVEKPVEFIVEVGEGMSERMKEIISERDELKRNSNLIAADILRAIEDEIDSSNSVLIYGAFLIDADDLRGVFESFGVK